MKRHLTIYLCSENTDKASTFNLCNYSIVAQLRLRLSYLLKNTIFYLLEMKIINDVLDTKGTKLPDFVTVSICSLDASLKNYRFSLLIKIDFVLQVVLWDTMAENVPIGVHILIMEYIAVTCVTVQRNSVILSMDVKLPAKQVNIFIFIFFKMMFTEIK